MLILERFLDSFPCARVLSLLRCTNFLRWFSRCSSLIFARIFVRTIRWFQNISWLIFAYFLGWFARTLSFVVGFKLWFLFYIHNFIEFRHWFCPVFFIQWFSPVSTMIWCVFFVGLPFFREFSRISSLIISQWMTHSWKFFIEFQSGYLAGKIQAMEASRSPLPYARCARGMNLTAKVQKIGAPRFTPPNESHTVIQSLRSRNQSGC